MVMLGELSQFFPEKNKKQFYLVSNGFFLVYEFATDCKQEIGKLYQNFLP